MRYHGSSVRLLCLSMILRVNEVDVRVAPITDSGTVPPKRDSVVHDSLIPE